MMRTLLHAEVYFVYGSRLVKRHAYWPYERDRDNKFVLWGQVHWADIKIELLDGYIEELQWYEDELGMVIAFDDWYDLVTNDANRSQIWIKSERIMKLTVYKALVELRRSWLFSDEDIKELHDKFKLNMHLSCDSFHGNYKVTETLDHHGSHVSFETNEVPLDVNVCGNYFLLKDLPFHFYKIVVHEMWHHFYYYGDRVWNSDFESICRSAQECSADDFVSQYATTNPVEDYAEHFMYRFLNLIPWNTDVLQKKTAHFERF